MALTLSAKAFALLVNSANHPDIFISIIILLLLLFLFLLLHIIYITNSDCLTNKEKLESEMNWNSLWMNWVGREEEKRSSKLANGEH